MWRAGVAISFVIGLVVLVAKLWLDDTAPVRANWRTATTMSGTGGGVLAAPSDPPAVTAFEPAPAMEQSSLPPAVMPSSDPGGIPPLDGAGAAPDADMAATASSSTSAEPAESAAVIAAPPTRVQRLLAAKDAAPPADRAFPPAEPRPATGPYSDLGPPPPRPAQVLPATKMIADVQHRLMTLGYDLGGADGRMGYRTEAAVRDFQKSISLRPDGRIDERLLVELDAAVRTRAQARQPQAPSSPPPSAAPAEQKRGVLGSVLGGFQRLIGQDLDSARRPAELAAYCRSNADTWIYDFGREAFVYCGNVNADSLSSAQKGGETAGGR